MRGTRKRAVSVTDKLVQERIKLLEADPEYIDLCYLVPKVLSGKESGKDFRTVTTDREHFDKMKGKGVILLSKHEWGRYEEFELLCEKLAKKYKLHWVAVEDLAMGVEQPTVSPRLSPTMTAYTEPVVFLPKPFDLSKRYMADCRVVPPLAALEIMKRVQQLDDKTKEEIKAYLFSLFKDIHGCRIVELHEQGPLRGKQPVQVELDVCLRVPVGYAASEVAELYRKVDKRRKDILASLGNPAPQRRRQSKTLMEAESLELLLPKKDVGILAIVDERFGAAGEDKRRKRSIINKRYKGKELLKKRLQAP